MMKASSPIVMYVYKGVRSIGYSIFDFRLVDCHEISIELPS